MKRSDRHSLSDGASRLFAFLCLEADRHTGRYEATQRDLAGALGKSKRIIGSYVAELEAKGVCSVRPGKNQFARTVFEITDRYWPRGIPLAVIQDAMLMGACRKYNSRFEDRAQEPIQSLRYFDQLIAEIQHCAELWDESLKSAKQAGGVMQEIVQ